MNIIRTDIKDVYVIEPKVFGDYRGYFFESFNKRAFEAETGIHTNFIQDNEAKSSRGVLRGLHYQKGAYAQSKLLRVVSGKVLDVVLDIRRNSDTFGKYFNIELSAENKKQLFIPKGFAHGYVVLEDNTIFQYKCDEYYEPSSEGSILWSDPELGIDWKLDPADIILSEKDQNAPIFLKAEI